MGIIQICILVYIALSTLLSSCYSKDQFTPTDLLNMNRISTSAVSIDGKYVVYGQKSWNKEKGKSSTNLLYTDISTKKKYILTEEVIGQSDTSPLFTTALPNHLLFLRSNSEVSSSLYYIEFPPKTEKVEPIRLTKYPVAISDYKVKKNSIVFSAEVYFNCSTLEESAEIEKEEEKATYQVYNSLFMFHWDHWLTEGKGSHIFLQKFIYHSENNNITLDGNAIDLTRGMELNTPPLFTDNSNYDISPDGTKVAFSAHLRNQEEAWTTNWKTYYYDINEMTAPIIISGHNPARTQYPSFNRDGTKIAYLAMKTPGLESEFLHFEIYNILTNKVDIIDDTIFDLSVTGYYWYNDYTINFVTTSLGQTLLYKVDFKDKIKPIYSSIPIEDNLESYGLPMTALKDRDIVIARKVGYNYPEQLVKIGKDGKEEEIVNLNEGLSDKFEFTQQEKFYFTGAYNDKVQGWILKPINFNEEKTYPTMLIVHGGPEQSSSSGWSFSWTPQMWTNQGYVVVYINFHGSPGVNSAFQDAVRDSWGGAPFEDIEKGMEYVFDTYKFIDPDKVCAAGASYGGYMINWLEGNSKKFKCLINHDGLFSHLSMFYSTEEIWFPKAEHCPREHIGCNPYDSKEIKKRFEVYSPETFVKNWETPMMVIHGGKDYRVPLTEGLMTFTALQLKNVKSKFLYLPMENHWVLKPENQIIWFEEAFSFVKEFLGE